MKNELADSTIVLANAVVGDAKWSDYDPKDRSLRHAINDKSMQMGRIDATVTNGTTEVW